MDGVYLHLRSGLSLVVIGLTLAWHVTTVAGAGEPEELEAKWRREIISGESSRTVAHAYRSLFAQAGAARFKHDVNVGIALQANWELEKTPVRRAPPAERRCEWGLDPRPIQRFLGYLEGRIGADVPGWWETNLMNADLFPNSHLSFPSDKLRFETTQLGIKVPAGTKVSDAGPDVVVSVGGEAVAIPRQAFCLEPSIRHTILVDGEMCFVASYRDAGYAFTLRRVNQKNREIAWDANVWAARQGFSSGPEGDHSVELRRSGNRVLVFGAESHAAYLESFDARTGDCEYRFCTSYWFHFSGSWRRSVTGNSSP